MNRIKGFALGLGVATLIVVGVACSGGNDEPPGSADFDAPPAQDRLTPSGSAGENTPNLTHGSPPPPASSGSPLRGSPEPSLKFGAVNYVHSGSAERPSGEGTVFVIDGIEINLDVLEMVGTTHEGNAAGIHDGLVVYRLKDGWTNDMYTFRPGEDHLNPEDGQIFTGQDSWTRWAGR